MIKKILRCDNTADNMVLKIFLSHFRLVFVSTTFTSLPPEVMLLNRTTLRDSATDIEKTS